MIIKQKLGLGNNIYYKVYSDNGFFVLNKTNQILFVEVFTTTPNDFEETSIKVEEENKV